MSDDPKTEEQAPTVVPVPTAATVGLTELHTEYFLAAWPDPETPQESIGVPYAPAEKEPPVLGEPYFPPAVPAEWAAPGAGTVDDDWNPPAATPADPAWTAPETESTLVTVDEAHAFSSNETSFAPTLDTANAETVAAGKTGKKAKQAQHKEQVKQGKKEKQATREKTPKREKAPKPAKQEKDPYRPRFAVAPAPVRIASLIAWAVAITLIGGSAATLSVVMSGTDTVNGVALPVLALWFIAAAQSAVAILWLLAGAGLARGDRAWWKITIALTFLLIPLLPVALTMWILLSMRGTRDWVV